MSNKRSSDYSYDPYSKRRRQMVRFRPRSFARYSSAGSSSVGSNFISPRGVVRTGNVKIRVNQIELKNIDVLTNADATATATIALINPCAQGTTSITRLGRSILMKGIQMKALFKREDPTTNSVQSVRFAIFYDKQVNGVAPAITDFFTSAVGSAPTWLRNLNTTDRFYCLLDKVINLDGAGGITIQTEELYRKLNLPVHFKDTTAGDVTDLVTGALWLVYAGNTAAGADDIDVEIQTRIRFSDC